MIPAPYSDILAALCDDMGWKRAVDGTPLLNDQEWHSAKRAVSRAIGAIWPRAFWRDLLNSDKRYFARNYSSTETVLAGVVRYHPAADRYYLCLQDEPLTEPAQLVDGVWEDIEGGWTQAKTAIETADAWDIATAYVVGDRVREATTGLTYQCLANHTGQEPPEGSYWGVVTPFQPAIDKFQPGKLPIGKVEGLYPVDPKVYRGARRMLFVDEADRILVRSLAQNFAWVRYMPPTPRLNGDIWSATATYGPLSTSTSESTTTVMGTALGYRGRDELRALTVYRDRQIFDLLWLVTDGDRNGGKFVYRAAETADDDDFDVLRPLNIAPSSPGRFVRDPNVT